MKYQRCIATVLLSLFALPALAGGAVLVSNGQNRSSIVVPADAMPATQAAVADLRHYLQRMAGVEVPVVHDPAAANTPVTIWVGDQPALRQRLAGAGVNFDFAESESLVILVRGNDVALLGRDEMVGRTLMQAGTSLAVYEFLEHVLGVRWLWPGELGEHVPRTTTLDVPDMEHRYAPQLKQRGLRIVNFERNLRYPGADLARLRPIMREMDRQADDWHRRQRAGGQHFRMRAGHAFTDWYDRLADQHPEYFALQPDGTRTAYPSPRTAKLCISNPAVWEQIMHEARQQLDRSPHVSMISGSPNDSGYSGWCRCDHCRAWDASNGPTITLNWQGLEEPHVALTDRYVRFWNTLAGKLREVYPDRPIQVGAWAYGAMRTPPIEAKLDERVIIGFVGALGASWQEDRRQDLEYWEQWSRMASGMVWRPNLFHYSWGMPYLFARRSGEDMRFLAERNLIGLDVDAIFHDWANQGLQYYLLAKLAWNPHADVEALIDDYVTVGFGPGAASHVRQYFDALEQLQYDLSEQARNRHRFAKIDDYIAIFNDETLDRLQVHLNAAAAAARGDDTHAQRVAFLQTGLDFTRAQVRVMRSMSILRGGQGDRREAVRQALDDVARRDAILERDVAGFALGYPQYHNSVAVRLMQPYLGPLSPRDTEMLEDNRIIPLPAQWQFRLDPTQQGDAQRWFDPQTPTDDWGSLLVSRVWNDQLPHDDPDDPVGNRYLGVAWYRTTLPALELAADERLWLEYGAIDESCWVYLDGRLLATQVFDREVDPHAWRKPRRFDITDALQNGPGVLVTKVQALGGRGGINQGVWLRRVKPNLLANGGFTLGPDGLEGWRQEWPNVPADQRPQVTITRSLGQHVDEPAITVHVTGQGEFGLNAVTYTDLPAGTYEVRVRYRQQFAATDDIHERPLAVRWTLVPRQGQSQASDRHWAVSPASSSTQWQLLHLMAQVEPGQDYRGAAVKLFLRGPGVFEIDEVVLRRQ